MPERVEPELYGFLGLHDETEHDEIDWHDS